MAPQFPLILTIDLGTSSARVSVYDATAVAVPGLEAREALAIPPQADVNAVASGVERAMDRLLELMGDDAGELAAVGFTTLASSVVGLDEKGRARTPLSLYSDTSAHEEARRLRRELDLEEIHRRTGCPIHTSYLPARLAHFIRNGTAAGVRRWADVGTYLMSRWMGRSVPTTYSIASWSGLLDRHRNRWDPDLLEYLGVDEGMLPVVGNGLEPISGLAPRYAARWPALADVPFFPAVGDGASANVGSGCVGANGCALTVGTSAALRVLLEGTPEAPASDGLWAYRLGPDETLLGASYGEGGNLRRWATSVLRLESAPDEPEDLERRPPAAHGLVVLPFITGERSPGWSLDAKPVIQGFTVQTKPVDLYQSMLEGMTYRYAAGWRTLLGHVDGAIPLVASGRGLTHSPYWMQLVADVFQHPVTPFADVEASSRGAAILALRGLGEWQSYLDVPPQLGRTYEPRPEYADVHAEAMEAQDRLYGALIDEAG